MKFCDRILFEMSFYLYILRVSQQISERTYNSLCLAVLVPDIVMLNSVDYNTHTAFALRKSLSKVLEHPPFSSLNLVLALSVGQCQHDKEGNLFQIGNHGFDVVEVYELLEPRAISVPWHVDDSDVFIHEEIRGFSD